MPSVNRANVTHLLRRTEFVARPSRLDHLLAMGSIEQVVDDVTSITTDPPALVLGGGTNWEQGITFTNGWLDAMAWDSSRPFRERMALFWHSHVTSGYPKVGRANLMAEQINTLRTSGLGDIGAMVTDVSHQVAMLRFLDNNRNRASSPNQNFARELLELFLLGVGNYSEQDVESATAAWTGHSQNWETYAYLWRGDDHDATPDKPFLGRLINPAGSNPVHHGAEVISTVLGDGIISAEAANASNRGRPSAVVAAEFLSRKLWSHFAGTPPPGAVIDRLAAVLVDTGFEARPWVRSLFTSEEFFAPDVRSGLVRTPVEYVVAMMYSLGLRAAGVAPLHLLESMGQRPMFPPSVEGWKTNDAWISPAQFGARSEASNALEWSGTRRYWGDGPAESFGVDLIGRSWTRAEVYDPEMTAASFVDGFSNDMHVELSSESRQVLMGWYDAAPRSERIRLISMIFRTPEFHLA